MMIRHDWHGLYRERWGDDLVPDAYAHPAKFARGLIRRIYAHLFEMGYLRPGDTVVDPFGGVALGALDAMRLGCHWFGSELEQKFVDLGSQNIDRWNDLYRGLWPDTWGTARIFQGDSRELGKVLREAGGLVSSPPYAASVSQSDGANDAGARIERKAAAGVDVTNSVNVGGPNSVLRQAQNYGTSPGQLAAMPEGRHDAVVSSPPYQGKRDDGGMIPGHMRAPGGKSQYRSGAYYGSSSGQLASMPEGEHDAVVSSPPFMNQSPSHDKAENYDGFQHVGSIRAGAVGYGYNTDNPDNLGNDTGTNFWTAARTIVDQCHLVLKPGAAAVWVVKRFVRNKEIVDFPDQWRQMCEAAGFETVEWIRAWLVEDRGTQIDLFGNDHEQRVERKSFFRRLYEGKYPHNSIDWEDVIIMRRTQ